MPSQDEPATSNAALTSRFHQMFPVLSADEIDRVRRFGEVKRFPAGDLLFQAGEAVAGMHRAGRAHPARVTARALLPEAGGTSDRGHVGRRGAQEPDEARAGAGPGPGGGELPLRTVRRSNRRRGSGRACDRGLRRVGGPVHSGAGSDHVWRTGRRQRAHRELSGISHRRLGAGADGPRVHAGAEVRGRVQPVHRGQAAGLRLGKLGS